MRRYYKNILLREKKKINHLKNEAKKEVIWDNNVHNSRSIYLDFFVLGTHFCLQLRVILRTPSPRPVYYVTFCTFLQFSNYRILPLVVYFEIRIKLVMDFLLLLDYLKNKIIAEISSQTITFQISLFQMKGKYLQ